MNNLTRSLLLILILLTFPILGNATSFVKLSIDSNVVREGQSFYIEIEADTDGPFSLEPDQEPTDFKVVYQKPSYVSGSSVSINNGQVTHSQISYSTLTLTCKANKPGKYTYGPITIDGVKSNTVSFEVVDANAYVAPSYVDPLSSFSFNIDPFAVDPAAIAAFAMDPTSFDPTKGPIQVGKGNEEMFLVADVNKTSAYEQEAIEYTVTLYTTYQDIRFLGAAASPKFEGFVIDESTDISQSFSAKQYKGKLYKSLVIAKYIIFPQKAGKLLIKGNDYTVATTNWSLYYDHYFGNMIDKQPVQLNISPNDIEINVKELPTPIPYNFIGGVGDFKITASMPNTNVATNIPSQLVFKVEGSGNIKYVKLPDIAPFLPKTIEAFSPNVTNDSKISGNTVTGSSTFDYSIIVKETGDVVIPAMEFSYFDPESGEYKTMKTEEIKLAVTQGQTSSRSQTLLTFESDLLPVGKTQKGEEEPYIESWLYWMWYAAFVFIFILCLASYRKYIRDHENIDQLRSKKANRMALRRLSKAYKCYKNGQEEAFYDEMLAALWGYLGDKLKMPTSELNRNNVGEEFKKHNVKESTFMPIINLIDECEYAKYTPVSRESNMRQLYSDAIATLSGVESEYEEEQNKDLNGQNESEESYDNKKYINTSRPGDEKETFDNYQNDDNE